MSKIITLCGSLKFQKEFNDIQMKLERAGNICFSVGFSESDYTPPTELEKEVLDKVHYRKISMSQCIIVIDIGGYIGNSTRGEIQFAKVFNIPVIRLSELNDLDIVHYINFL